MYTDSNELFTEKMYFTEKLENFAWSTVILGVTVILSNNRVSLSAEVRIDLVFLYRTLHASFHEIPT